MRLQDKIAIITGGSRGIGYATAERFIQEGAAVILAASTQESADPWELAVRMTTAPSWRNLSAVAKPMPLLPPVISATLSFSLIFKTAFPSFVGFSLAESGGRFCDMITLNRRSVNEL